MPRFPRVMLPEAGEITISQGIDFCSALWYFLIVKGCEEDMPVRKESQRGTRLVRGFRSPAGEDTTSEPRVRKCHAGYAR